MSCLCIPQACALGGEHAPGSSLLSSAALSSSLLSYTHPHTTHTAHTFTDNSNHVLWQLGMAVFAENMSMSQCDVMLSWRAFIFFFAPLSGPPTLCLQKKAPPLPCLSSHHSFITSSAAPPPIMMCVCGISSLSLTPNISLSIWDPLFEGEKKHICHLESVGTGSPLSLIPSLLYICSLFPLTSHPNSTM